MIEVEVHAPLSLPFVMKCMFDDSIGITSLSNTRPDTLVDRIIFVGQCERRDGRTTTMDRQ